MSSLILLLILVGVIVLATLITLALGDDRKQGRHHGGDSQTGTWWGTDGEDNHSQPEGDGESGNDGAGGDGD